MPGRGQRPEVRGQKSVRTLKSNIQHRTSNIQYRTSNIQHPPAPLLSSSHPAKSSDNNDTMSIEPLKALIVHLTPGSEVLVSTALLENFRTHHVTWIVAGENAPLLRGMAWIDRLVCAESPEVRSQKSVRTLKSNIQHRTSNIQYPISNIQYPISNIEHRTSNIEHPASPRALAVLKSPRQIVR